MDRQLSSPCSTSSAPKPPQNLLRSSVSMFIEDSRITAVANAEPPPIPSTVASRRPSYFSVTSYTSSSSTSGGGPGPSSSSYLRPTFCQISATLPNQQRVPPQVPPQRPRACSSSPVRYPGREFIHSIIREDDEELMTTRSVSSSPGRRHPPPPPSTVRRRSTLSMEPVMSFMSVKEALPTVQEDRAYTSVNLTLRTPSLGGGSGGGGAVISGGAPGLNVVNTVNVKMDGGGTTFRHTHSHQDSGGEEGASGGGDRLGDEEGAVGGAAPPGTNLMYSSYSNCRDGFEAQVQIQFGPNGGTFTASRRRNTGVTSVGGGGGNLNFREKHHHHNISIRQQMSTDLLSAQTERKEKLRAAIHDRRCLLAKLEAEVGHLRTQLELRGSFSELERLKQENRKLRIECNFMSREVDLYQNGNTPLGETNEEFYQGINPGQSLTALFGITNNRRKIGGPGGTGPPPRPPPPKFGQNRSLTPASTPTGGEGEGGRGRREEEDGDGSYGEWICSMCTFQNHRDLESCEQCNMVRTKQPYHPPPQQPSHHQYHHHHHHAPN